MDACVNTPNGMRFEPTYKELKPLYKREQTSPSKGFEPTYKELKHIPLLHLATNYSPF